MSGGVHGCHVCAAGTGCSLCYRFDPSVWRKVFDFFLASGSLSAHPQFPATSPSLTCVGATQFDQASPPYTSESAVNQFGSGGGFSWTFPRPAYQNAAVASYFKYSQPSHLHFNSAGRATPDVAALGIGFGVVVNGGIESIGGTSAAGEERLSMQRLSVSHVASQHQPSPPSSRF